MNSLSVELNTKDLENKLRLFAINMKELMEPAMDSIGEQMASQAKSLAPVRTGKLQAAIKYLKDKQGTGYLTTKETLGKKANVFYSLFVETGVNVSAKKKDYLVFKIGNEWKKVQSVSTKAHPFLRPVYNEFYSENGKAYKILSDELEKLIEEQVL